MENLSLIICEMNSWLDSINDCATESKYKAQAVIDEVHEFKCWLMALETNKLNKKEGEL